MSSRCSAGLQACRKNKVDAPFSYLVCISMLRRVFGILECSGDFIQHPDVIIRENFEFFCLSNMVKLIHEIYAF